jgi:DNA (cytosine-5)-methyltransferase 1
MCHVKPFSVSLFSGGGFGDCGIEFGGKIPVISCCELLESRARILRSLFPNATVHQGDVHDLKDEIINDVRHRIKGRPWLVIMSPPCQGMSTNGLACLAAAIARGDRPAMDERNRLILPAIDIVEALQPQWIIVENVPNMRKTAILNERGELENILDLLTRRLSNYQLESQILDAASYGVPQHRKRLITIGYRGHLEVALHASPMHSSVVTFNRATQHLPPLDAQFKPQDLDDPLHMVPVWHSGQIFAMQHTPEGGTAFNNMTCIRCGTVDADSAVIECRVCRMWLPKPRVKDHSRLIKAFKTTYKRMFGDRPASTLTTISQNIASDNKGHPTQTRVLSVREVLIVASMAPYPGFTPEWGEAANIIESLSPKIIREVAGESIPPLVTSTLVRHLKAIDPDI